MAAAEAAEGNRGRLAPEVGKYYRFRSRGNKYEDDSEGHSKLIIGWNEDIGVFIMPKKNGWYLFASQNPKSQGSITAHLIKAGDILEEIRNPAHRISDVALSLVYRLYNNQAERDATYDYWKEWMQYPTSYYDLEFLKKRLAENTKGIGRNLAGVRRLEMGRPNLPSNVYSKIGESLTGVTGNLPTQQITMAASKYVARPPNRYYSRGGRRIRKTQKTRKQYGGVREYGVRIHPNKQFIIASDIPDERGGWELKPEYLESITNYLINKFNNWNFWTNIHGIIAEHDNKQAGIMVSFKDYSNTKIMKITPASYMVTTSDPASYLESDASTYIPPISANDPWMRTILQEFTTALNNWVRNIQNISAPIIPEPNFTNTNSPRNGFNGGRRLSRVQKTRKRRGE